MDKDDLKAIWAPDPTAHEFEANGTRYTISSRLSIERLALHQRYELEFGFNASFLGMLETLQKCFHLLNDKKFAEAAVHIHNTIHGMAKTEEGDLQSVRLCSLFINYEGEDTTTYNEDIYQRKLNDWKKANIDAMYFFQRAALSSNGYINAYKELIQNTLTAPVQE